MNINSPYNLFSVAEIKLVYSNKVKPEDRLKVTRSSNAYDILLSAWDMNKIELVEQFMILLLDRNNACLGVSNVATGAISACLVDPKIVFATALKARASAIVLAHNHPSGSMRPSQADISFTQKIVSAGKYLDITVADHLLVSPRGYFSFADDGLMPT